MSQLDDVKTIHVEMEVVTRPTLLRQLSEPGLPPQLFTVYADGRLSIDANFLSHSPNNSSYSDEIHGFINADVDSKDQNEPTEKKEAGQSYSSQSHSSQNSSSASTLSLAPILNPEAEIDLGDIYYEYFYHTRSFVVANHSCLPMDFSLSSDIPQNDFSELSFSLNPHSLTPCYMFTVDPKSRQNVYIYLRPLSTLVLQDGESTNLQYHIFVNCRAVRDYQATVD